MKLRRTALALGLAGTLALAGAPGAHAATTAAPATTAAATAPAASTIVAPIFQLVGPFNSYATCQAVKATFQAKGYKTFGCFPPYVWLTTSYAHLLPRYPFFGYYFVAWR